MRRVLIFRHGILINRWLLEPMARHFRRQGYEVHNPSYPSTRKRIEEHARDLAEEARRVVGVLDGTGEEHELYYVTHSMGGLILRYALTHFDMPRPRRAVLFVPPNQGSATARTFRKLWLYRWLFGGKSGAQLAEEPPGIFGECGIPAGVEIGVIAGDVAFRFYPGRLESPNDGVVSVAEARLDGCSLKVLPFRHTPILWRRAAWQEAASFLERGEFREGATGPQAT